MKLKFLVFTSFLFLFQLSFSQSRVERKANEYYEGLAFAKAIPWYKRALEKEEKPEYILRLADAYRRTHQYEEAAIWYERAMNLPYQPPETQFHYAHSLLLKGNFEAAKRNFREYSLSNPDDPRGNYFANGIEQVEEMVKDSVFFTFRHLPFNTKNTEFGGIPYGDGIIIASSRIEGTRTIVRNFQWKDTPFLNLVYFEKQDSTDNPEDEYDSGVTLSDEINSKFHESNFTWSPNSDKIYFTRNNFLKKKGTNEAGIILLKIYEARMEGFKIGEVKEFPYNSDDYSVTHPSLSADGNRLYFVSDMPGGRGGKDIYYCDKRGDGWSNPVNAGKEINTTGDEVFPFIHPDGTLYFSSDGHPGLGFLDVFKVDVKGGSKQVMNLGYPINSSWDDFAIYMNETADTGFVSSNRPGGAGDDDIYEFTIKRPEIEIYVLDSVAQLPIEGAEIAVTNQRYNTEEIFVSDSTGYVRFPADFGVDYTGLVTTTEFDPKGINMSTVATTPKLLFSYEVQLYNPPPAITAIVIDEATQKRLPDTRVDIVKRISNDTIVRNTDRNGRFAVKLEKNTYYTINVRRKGYYTYTQNVSTTQTTFEGDTIIPLKMVPIELNKPIVLENIHYDFDKWTLRPEAYIDLNMIVTLMTDNPELVVEFSSHTDSRGSDSYNLRLSRRRASSVRLYLLQNGIGPERFSAVGMGEAQPVNRCTNGVPCSEDEHFQNRRTEFKVVGYIDGIDMENSVLETSESGNPPPKYVPVGKEEKLPAGNDAKSSKETIKESAPKSGKEIIKSDQEPTPKEQLKSDLPAGEKNAITETTDGENEADMPPAVEPSEKFSDWEMEQPADKGENTELVVTESSVPEEEENTPPAGMGITADETPSGSEEESSSSSSSAVEAIKPPLVYDAPEAIKDETVRFRVRMGAFARPLNATGFADLGPLKPYLVVALDEGMFTYYIGDYRDYGKANEALKHIQSLGYEGAYIAAFKKEIQLSFSEMMSEIAK